MASPGDKVKTTMALWGGRTLGVVDLVEKTMRRVVEPTTNRVWVQDALLIKIP